MTIPTRVKFSRRASAVVAGLGRRIGRSGLAARAETISARAREAGRYSDIQKPETVDTFLWLVSYRNELLRCSH